MSESNPKQPATCRECGMPHGVRDGSCTQFEWHDSIPQPPAQESEVERLRRAVHIESEAVCRALLRNGETQAYINIIKSKLMPAIDALADLAKRAADHTDCTKGALLLAAEAREAGKREMLKRVSDLIDPAEPEVNVVWLLDRLEEFSLEFERRAEGK